eukprot:TRINITY_DN15435_c0_g1_i1.p1 TRINITY_DN15435_c0_g1~~TRINITY_DN15435_c0_g1_i1.p1  ORF type:complete len:432 (-),score=43.75 TRINITY_DN15435_c0_g1_i1:634-1929(-)
MAMPYVWVALLLCASGHACEPGSQPSAGSWAGGFIPRAEETCESCPAGTYSEKKGQQQCIQCSSGKFAESKGSRSCQDCPVGRAAAQLGAVACRACEEGKFAAEEGKMICKLCPSGSYSPNATSCIRCPEGQHSMPGSMQCKECKAWSDDILQCASVSTPYSVMRYLTSQRWFGIASLLLFFGLNVVNFYHNGCCCSNPASLSGKEMKSRVWKILFPGRPQPRFWPAWVLGVWDVIDWAMFVWWFLNAQPEEMDEQNAKKDFATDPFVLSVCSVLVISGPLLPLLMTLLEREYYCFVHFVYDALQVGVVAYVSKCYVFADRSEMTHAHLMLTLCNVGTTAIDMVFLKGPELLDTWLADSTLGQTLLDVLDPEGAVVSTGDVEEVEEAAVDALRKERTGRRNPTLLGSWSLKNMANAAIKAEMKSYQQIPSA